MQSKTFAANWESILFWGSEPEHLKGNRGQKD
jgi:hypothetical protein